MGILSDRLGVHEVNLSRFTFRAFIKVYGLFFFRSCHTDGHQDRDSNSHPHMEVVCLAICYVGPTLFTPPASFSKAPCFGIFTWG